MCPTSLVLKQNFLNFENFVFHEEFVNWVWLPS
jgi:hypothetical protein